MVDEQLGHGDTEQLRHAQGQRQAGIVLVGFDRVDRLARDAEPPGQLALAPPPPLADRLQVVLQDDSPACKEFFTGARQEVSRALYRPDGHSRDKRAAPPTGHRLPIVDLRRLRLTSEGQETGVSKRAT